MRAHRVEPVRASGLALGIFLLGSMLTARSECHVSREAAVIRSGNGTLHWGVYHFEFETRLSTQANMQIIRLMQVELLICSLASYSRMVVSCDQVQFYPFEARCCLRRQGKRNHQLCSIQSLALN